MYHILSSEVGIRRSLGSISFCQRTFDQVLRFAVLMDDFELEVPSKRVFEPLWVPTGDVSIDRLAFFHVLERLKVCIY